MSTNDNVPRAEANSVSLPDAHAQAALVLAESLIHGLVERSILTTTDAIEIIESAKSVQIDIADATEAPGAAQAHALLTDMAASLQYDVIDDKVVPLR